MVDMGQADSSLYRNTKRTDDRGICWTRALKLAAANMGYQHYMDVPAQQGEELRAKARRLMGILEES